MKNQFLLVQFKMANGDVLVTRGRTETEARKYLEEICGQTIVEIQPYCRIDAAYRYSINHPFDWLNSAPRWLDPEAPWLPTDYRLKERFFHHNIRI